MIEKKIEPLESTPCVPPDARLLQSSTRLSLSHPRQKQQSPESRSGVGGRWGGRGDGAGLSLPSRSLKQSAVVSAHTLQRLARGSSGLHRSSALQARRLEGGLAAEAVRFHLDGVREEIGIGVTLRHQ